jgi:putative DNA primase/helicase
MNNIELVALKGEITGLLCLNDNKLENKNTAIEIMINAIKKEFNIYTLKDDNKPEVWIYENGVYVPNGISVITEFYRLVMKENYSSMFLNQVITRIKADTMINQEIFFNNNLPYDLVLKNGVLNLKTFKLLPNNKNDIHFNKLNIEYDKTQDCPKIKDFLSDILEKGDIEIFQEFLGFCLVKKYNFQKAMIFLGGGNNGKSVLLDLIKRFMGIENTTGYNIGEFDDNDDKYKLCGLHRKLLNIAGDVTANALKDTATIKKVTGGDLVTANRKFLNPIHFVNHSKFISSFNQLPIVYDVTDGFMRRWLIIDFKQTFQLKKDYDKLSNDEKLNIKLADENILTKISTQSELIGFLNFALQGLKRLNENKGFSSNATTEEVKNKWIRQSDSLRGFCLDRLDDECYDSDVFITSAEFKREYMIYCKINKIRKMSDKHIKHILTTDYGAEKRFMNNNEHTGNVWSGIRFKEIKKVIKDEVKQNE